MRGRGMMLVTDREGGTRRWEERGKEREGKMERRKRVTVCNNSGLLSSWLRTSSP